METSGSLGYSGAASWYYAAQSRPAVITEAAVAQPDFNPAASGYSPSVNQLLALLVLTQQSRVKAPTGGFKVDSWQKGGNPVSSGAYYPTDLPPAIILGDESGSGSNWQAYLVAPGLLINRDFTSGSVKKPVILKGWIALLLLLNADPVNAHNYLATVELLEPVNLPMTARTTDDYFAQLVNAAKTR